MAEFLNMDDFFNKHNSDFKVVTSKRRNRRHVKHASEDFAIDKDDCSIDKESAVRRTNSAKENILSSDFYSSLSASLREAFNLIGNPNVKEIISFGLGHIGDCMISRYQFALLLCLKDKLKVKTLVYDPIFYKTEIELLNHYDCELLSKNEEGKRKIDPQTTLLYFPHCPKQLTNNFLWKNWNVGLKDCIIIGNSISHIVESAPKRLLVESAKYILSISPHVDEFSVINNFKYSDIFNDMSVHVFQESKLKWLPPEFWDDCEEPYYIDTDLELITEEISNLSIPKEL